MEMECISSPKEACARERLGRNPISGLRLRKRKKRKAQKGGAAAGDRCFWCSDRSATSFAASLAGSPVLARYKEPPEMRRQPRYGIIGRAGGIPGQSPSPSPAEGPPAEPPTGSAPTASGSTDTGRTGTRDCWNSRSGRAPRWGRFPGTPRSPAPHIELPTLPEGLGWASASRDVTKTSGTSEGRRSGSSPSSSPGQGKLWGRATGFSTLLPWDHRPPRRQRAARALPPHRLSPTITAAPTSSTDSPPWFRQAHSFSVEVGIPKGCGWVPQPRAASAANGGLCPRLGSLAPRMGVSVPGRGASPPDQEPLPRAERSLPPGWGSLPQAEGDLHLGPGVSVQGHGSQPWAKGPLPQTRGLCPRLVVSVRGCGTSSPGQGSLLQAEGPLPQAGGLCSGPRGLSSKLGVSALRDLSSRLGVSVLA